ncbi:MAG: DUF1501 domain-containing protein [Acidobacteriota bacterium]|nr:DUF1501 domain-containing protein [Acidobacteriota bacterium]
MTLEQFRKIQSRRNFFKECAGGLGTIALANLLERDGFAASALPSANPLAPKPPQFASKAKNVIFLFMEGGPSQLDLFDPKPELKKWNGKPLPESITKNLQLAFIKPTAAVLASQREFQKHGQCGMEISDYLPHIASCADDICLIRSMHTDAFNHHPGQLLLFSGTTQVGRPTMGAWVVYGLGSESQNLPGFVVLSSGVGTSGGASNFSSGFLPSTYQGTMFRNSGDPILYLSNPQGITAAKQRADLDAIRDLNTQHLESTGDREIASRIASYELAFRMQTAGPELLDFSKESPETLEMYGVNKEPTRPYATNCLLARRMIERGVRFVMLMHASWDDHTNINTKLKKNCDITDQPAAALIKDLKQRGLLDTTLVVWGGEFGRTPMCEIRKPEEADNAGRDHHPVAYSMWMAGGGIKGGQVVGSTDDLCFNILEDKVHVHDLQATILNRLGFDHTRLTYRYMGRDFRLTDVEGNVVKKLLA